MGRILVVDDEVGIANMLQIALSQEGHDVDVAYSAREALEKATDNPPDVAVIDIRMEGMSGLDLLSALRNIGDVTVIMMTAYASVESAVESLRKGAFDYIMKPFDIDEMKVVVDRAFEYRKLMKENRKLREEIRKYRRYEKLIGEHPAFRAVLEKVRIIAKTDSTVMIYGESGTGKELVARELHSLSNRANGPFVAINMASIPEDLLESELFCHNKWAFTGASYDKKGLFVAANGGTLFLDEISETSPKLQAKLLRAIESKEITPLGATKPIKVDVRIVAATNKNLKRLVEEKKFREDLFYRLNVITIRIPPLRERKSDIPLLVDYFLNKYSVRHGLPNKKITREALDILTKYSWPGNVRELEHVIEQALILSQGDTIDVDDLPNEIKNAVKRDKSSRSFMGLLEQEGLISLEELEEKYIQMVLNETGWDKRRAAAILGIDLSTLYRKITKYNIKKED